MPQIKSFSGDDALRDFVAFAVLVTSVRLVALFYSDINLGPDETQYWFWSKTPAFGYFSKPPMIAWMISATTSIFGDGEWAVRLSAPLLHVGTASFLFLLTRRLYGNNAAFWAGVIWLTLPGVSLSSMVISTDALLLFFWAASMYFFFRLAAPEREEKHPLVLAALLGGAIGLGFLSKYAMIYFIAGLLSALIISKARINWLEAAIAAITALAIIAPNIVWNANNGFQTVTHTAANADWGDSLFHPIALLEFIMAQFGVFGPLTFALVVFGLATMASRLKKAGEVQWADLALIAFTMPPLLIVSTQAFISRAHANWGAAAFPAAAILIAAWAFRSGSGRVLKSAVALNFAAAAIFMVAVINFSIADSLGLSDVIKRVRGWEAQGAEVVRLSPEFDAVMTDDREVMGGILYYGRQSKTPVVAWNSNIRIDDHYEAFNPFRPEQDKKVLYVTPNADAIGVRGQFNTIKRLGETTAFLEQGRYRRLYLFELSGHRKLSGNLLEEEQPF